MFFLYLHPEPHHGRREGHPHEAHQEDEIFIKHHNINVLCPVFQDKPI